MKNNVPVYRNDSDNKKTQSTDTVSENIKANRDSIDKKVADMPKEVGGRPKDKGLEPTRYGDWELKGRCIDF